MDSSYHFILEADPAGVARRSAPGTCVSYAVATCRDSETRATGYAVYWKCFDFPADDRDILHPHLTGPELNTLRRVDDLEALAKLVKNEPDGGGFVLTLPADQLFDPDAPHPPLRPLTPEEVMTIRRLAEVH